MNEKSHKIDEDLTKMKSIEILKKELKPFLNDLFGDSDYKIRWVPILKNG